MRLVWNLRDSHAGKLAIAREADGTFAGLALARMHLDKADLSAHDVTMESVAANDLRSTRPS